MTWGPKDLTVSEVQTASEVSGRVTLRGDGSGEAWVEYRPGFVPDHGTRMETLLSELPLAPQSLRIMGRDVLTPRLCCWMGDGGCSYTYSGRRFDPVSWHPLLRSLRDRLDDLLGVPFNSVLVNYYRDGKDSMGAHADNEPELGPAAHNVVIASVTLGARRRFILRHEPSGWRRTWLLGEGDLFVMGGTTQRHHKHAVPKTKRAVGARMNLTYRLIQPAAPPATGP